MVLVGYLPGPGLLNSSSNPTADITRMDGMQRMTAVAPIPMEVMASHKIVFRIPHSAAGISKSTHQLGIGCTSQSTHRTPNGVSTAQISTKTKYMPIAQATRKNGIPITNLTNRMQEM